MVKCFFGIIAFGLTAYSLHDVRRIMQHVFTILNAKFFFGKLGFSGKRCIRGTGVRGNDIRVKVAQSLISSEINFWNCFLLTFDSLKIDSLSTSLRIYFNSLNSLMSDLRHLFIHFSFTLNLLFTHVALVLDSLFSRLRPILKALLTQLVIFFIINRLTLD